jgi:hypothetical protein
MTATDRDPPPRLSAVQLPRSAQRFRSAFVVSLAGAAVSLAVGVALFARWGIHGNLSRDEAIYTYGGQQMAHGVPPYTSIFDPKGPLAMLFAGVAASIARALGNNDVYSIRVAYFIASCLTVVAVYLLSARLFRSPLAGVVAAVVFASFTGFAEDALSGPDAKTPGVLAAVLTMWLMARRQWFWAAFAGSVAVLDWQPLVIYPVMAGVLALLLPPAGQRLRSFGAAAAGFVIPIAVVTGYFAITGGLRNFYEAAFAYPATGVVRPNETVLHRWNRIVTVVRDFYGFSGVLFWVGLALLVVVVVAHLVRRRSDLGQALREPLVLVVLVTLLAEAGYALYDFQGYPDILPLLVYPALGLAGTAALLIELLRSPQRRYAATAVLAAVAVLAAFSWVWFGNDFNNNHGLRAQGADACAVERLLGPGGRLWAMGDPAPLVLTHLRNPDNFIYLGSGVDRWKVNHTPGGFDGWVAQVRAVHPAVVAMNTWNNRLSLAMKHRLLADGYRPGWVGTWHVYLTPAARSRALADNVTLTPRPTAYATSSSGQELPNADCA